MKKGYKKMAKLSPPWITYYRKIEALFEQDPQVKVVVDETSLNIKLYVESAVKAEAIEKLLPKEKEFGNVTVTTTVIPANEQKLSTLFKTAFDGNPALCDVKTVSSPLMGEASYVIFQKKVVQFFNDDLGDPNGNMSTLYQDIADDVFGYQPGMFYCTASMDPWPSI